VAEETCLRVNENGRVVILASFRKALGINVGDEIALRLEETSCALRRSSAVWSDPSAWFRNR